jgi:hypothetical protein
MGAGINYNIIFIDIDLSLGPDLRCGMDKFDEMMQKMSSMSGAERDAMMNSARAACTCGKCPTYNDCGRSKGELLFCATGKSACAIKKKACLCPGCPVTPMLGLMHGYYCASGSEKELRQT